MQFFSTRDQNRKVTSSEAIAQGLSNEGGLFVPETIPSISMDELKSLAGMNYAQRAAFVFSKYLTDYTDAELRYCTESAYTTKAFDTENIAEIAHLFEGTYMLELWHGPTCAFKDMALQILPYFLTTAVKKLHMDKKVVILVATSGDTGKAALEGFKDVPGTEIMVFYPVEGVSDMQKRQMVTQEGENVTVCAVKGNFDDCQSGVKKIFTDHKVLEALEQAKRPVINAGNGIRIGAAHDVFMRVVEKLGIPVVTGADSIDCIYDEHPLYIGKGGNVGDRPGNFAIQNSDLVLSLGSRLSFRQVGYRFTTWAREAYVIVNDIDAEELKKPTLHVDMPVHADAKDLLETLAALLKEEMEKAVSLKVQLKADVGVGKTWIDAK